MLTAKEKLELIGGTLEWCNAIRDDRGQPALAELPKGYRHDPASCPCGRATGVHVGSSVWAEDKDDLEMRDYSMNTKPPAPSSEPRGAYGETPDVVRRFVRAFDCGELPDLIDGAWAG